MASKKTAQGLTEKQARFCIEYIDNGGNASEAYRICYDCSNMKPESIWVNACKLLSNTKIALRIADIKEERAKRAERGREICNNALLDIVETTTDDLYYIDPRNGKMRTRSPQQLPQRARNAVKKLTNDNGRVSYELNGKVDAIKAYAAINGLNSAQEVKHSYADGQAPRTRVKFVFGKRDDADE